MNPDFKKDYYLNLFTWKEFEYLLNIRPLMTDKRVFILDGGGAYSWGNSASSIDKNCYPPSLLKDLLQKHICYFRDMSRATEKINDFAKTLEKKYKKQSDAHLYVCRNPELEHPFGVHYDYVPNVIVQCEGQTNFKVWDKVEHISEDNVNLKIDDEPLLDVIMSPGDTIWIPEHYPHHAISITPRLSVSFPIQMHEGDDMEDRHWFRFEG